MGPLGPDAKKIHAKFGVNPSSGFKATPGIKLMSAIALRQRGFATGTVTTKKVFEKGIFLVFALDLVTMWANRKTQLTVLWTNSENSRQLRPTHTAHVPLASTLTTHFHAYARDTLRSWALQLI